MKQTKSLVAVRERERERESYSLKKGNKGITLIALVITIIVLLILAGVTIAMLTGENGILTQSSKATVTQIEANVDERVRIAVQGCKIAIANETVNDQSWSAVTDGIKPSDNKLDRASASGLTDETTNGVILASIAEDLKDTGYFISATTPTGEGTAATRDMVIEYSGDDYKKATNNSNAKIEYTLNITQHEVKIAYRQIASSESSQDGGDSQGSESGTGISGLPSNSETTPWLPTGATKVEGTDLTTGLSVVDGNGNYWTWVVVPKSVTASVTEDTDIETALRSYCTENEVTKPTNYTYTDEWHYACGLTNAQYKEKKSAMLQRIKEYGGFWVGKYEVGYIGTPTRDGNSGLQGNSDSNPTTQEAKIIPNAYPYNYVTCAQAEKIAEGLTSSLGGTGSLMFGIQWDLIMVYLKINAGVNINDGTIWGNHSDSAFDITNASAQGTTKPHNGGWAAVTEVKNGTATLLTTGAEESVTNKLNIVDLAGNVYEFTLEKTTASYGPCVIRGGDYYNLGSGRPVLRTYKLSYECNFQGGLRPALY